MTRFSLSLAVLALTVSRVAAASSCDAHYPLDGSLADATGNGYDGMMIAKDGAPEKPQFADGKFGQALHITENSAMRAFLDLHHETCPQFTITGWFRLPSVGDGAPQGILSTGARGGIPAVVATGSTLMLYGSGNGLWQKDAIRDGNTWYFVAATFDYVSRTYKLYWRNRAQEGKLSEKPYEAEDAFWIGARSDNFRYPAKDLYVDDVRVYGRVLDLNEIREASRNAVARGTVQGATVIAPVTDGSPTKIGRIGSGPTIELPEDAVSTRPPIGGDPILDVDSSGESDEWNDAGLQIADPVSQAVLTGRLTDAAGNGVPDSAVAVLRAANMQVITRTRTDANGEYTVAVFASEPVFLRFRNVYSFPNMSLVYFGGAVQPEGAQSLKIKPGQTVKADASLKVQECRISGVVSHESGLRLPGIRVGLYAWDAFDKPRPSPLHAVSTNSRGEFSIELTTLEEWSQVEDSFAVGCYGSACAEYTFMRLFAVDPTGSYESAMPPQRIYMTVSANVYSPGSDDQCNGSDNLFMMQ